MCSQGYHRLAFFDLDGTLKRERSPYAYLHEKLGFSEQCKEYAAAYYRGEIDYAEWLHRDIQLWRGTSLETIEGLLREDPYLPGGPELVRQLQGAGFEVIIVSSGPDVHVRLVAEELDVRYWIANHVGIANGAISGETAAHVPEGSKGHIVRRYVQELGCSPADCLAVGDSYSDVDMFREVRLSVAVNPSAPIIARSATCCIPGTDLRPLWMVLREMAPEWF